MGTIYGGNNTSGNSILRYRLVYSADIYDTYVNVSTTLYLDNIGSAKFFPYNQAFTISEDVTISGTSYTVSRTINGIDAGASAIVGTVGRSLSRNSDGSCYTSFSVTNYNLANSITYTSRTLVNPTPVPQYANITSFYVKWSLLKGFGLGYTTDSNCDWVQYRVNGGDWINGVDIDWLQPNTTYDLEIRVKRTDSQLWTTSWVIRGTTLDIAKVTSANDFNDEQNPYMTFSNPSGAAIKAYLRITNPSGALCERDDIANNGSYTFTLTEAEKNIIYAACPNSSYVVVSYGIVTKVNGNDAYWHWVDRTVSIVNASPTFSNFTYRDVQENTVALTGSNQKIITCLSNPHINVSDIAATITLENKAMARKGATMSKYIFVMGDSSKEVSYSDTDTVETFIYDPHTPIMRVYAVDSRGYSTAVDKVASSYVTYLPLNMHIPTVFRASGGIGTTTTLNLSGVIWNNNFGAVANSVVSCSYKYKKTSSSIWIDGTTNIMPNLSENTFSKSVEINGDLGVNGFDSNYSYNIQITIVDRLLTITKEIFLQSGKPQLAFGSEKGVAIGDFYDETLGGDLQIGKKAIGETKNIDNVDANTIDYNIEFAYGNDVVNAPTAWGWLTCVIHHNSKDYRTQTWTDVTSTTKWTRTMYDNVWTDWSQDIQSTYSGISDLNNLIKAGNYGLYSGIHAPTDVIGVLEVLVYSKDWIIQKYTTIDGAIIVYTRRWYGGNTWSDWERNITAGNAITCIRNRAYFNFASAWTMYNIGLSSIKKQVGNRLSLSGGNIVIGAGVKFITVSATVSYNSSQAGSDKSVGILKNGVSVAVPPYDSPIAGSTWRTQTIASQGIDVVQGDTISLGFMTGGAGSMELLDSCLTVEVIC